MAKKRLTQLAKELDCPVEEMYNLVVNNLSEEMVTGSGKAIWINEAGQIILDDLVPMPVIYRGEVLRACKNSSYVYTRHRDRGTRVPVKIPKKMEGKLIGKMIYFEETRHNGELKYHWVKR